MVIIVDFGQCLYPLYRLYLCKYQLLAEYNPPVCDINEVTLIFCHDDQLVFQACEILNVGVEQFQVWVVVEVYCADLGVVFCQ